MGVSNKRAQIDKKKKVSNENEDDCFISMFNDVEDCFVDRPYELSKILEEVDKTIYLGSKITKLSFLIRLYNLKARNGWSDNKFSQLLSLLENILLEDNNIPKSVYEVKKTLLY